MELFSSSGEKVGSSFVNCVSYKENISVTEQLILAIFTA
jgi:hypothetical protein